MGKYPPFNLKTALKITHNMELGKPASPLETVKILKNYKPTTCARVGSPARFQVYQGYALDFFQQLIAIYYCL